MTNITFDNATIYNSLARRKIPLDNREGPHLNCLSICDKNDRISTVRRLIIVSVYIIQIIVNILMNILSIYVNVNTDHWKNQSMRMVLYISVVDILLVIFGNIPHTIHILIPNQLNFQQRAFLMFLPPLFVHLSLYAVIFLAVDRFLHVMKV